MATPVPNQFSQIPVQGQMDLEFNGSTIAAQVDAAQATSLVAGQAVKLATTSGGLPKVIALAANTDQAFGFVARNLKDASYAAYSNMTIAQFGSAMWMTAGAAITRGSSVEVANSTTTVITNAGVNPVVGYALDTAVNNGDLIRVAIQAPYSAQSTNLTQRVQQVQVTALLAEINAGKTIIPAVAGQAITVLDYTARVSGAFATGTGVILESSNATPVVVTTILEAALTNNAINLPASANNTLGAGFATKMGVGDGLVVANSGSAQTGGTSIVFTITFMQA
jgi:hypothetical protein